MRPARERRSTAAGCSSRRHPDTSLILRAEDGARSPRLGTPRMSSALRSREMPALLTHVQRRRVVSMTSRASSRDCCGDVELKLTGVGAEAVSSRARGPLPRPGSAARPTSRSMPMSAPRRRRGFLADARCCAPVLIAIVCCPPIGQGMPPTISGGAP